MKKISIVFYTKAKHNKIFQKNTPKRLFGLFENTFFPKWTYYVLLRRYTAESKNVCIR